MAAEFPSASRDDWLKLVRTVLKDQPFERLIAKTYDGLAIEPLYGRAKDARPLAARRGAWNVMARIDHPDPAIANELARYGRRGVPLVLVYPKYPGKEPKVLPTVLTPALVHEALQWATAP